MNAISKRKQNYIYLKKYDESKNCTKDDEEFSKGKYQYSEKRKRIVRDCHKDLKIQRYVKKELNRRIRRNKNFIDDVSYLDDVSFDSNLYKPKKYVSDKQIKKQSNIDVAYL